MDLIGRMCWKNLKIPMLQSLEPRAEVSGGKHPISQRENLHIECAQGHQPVRCPNRVFCGVVFLWCVGGADVMCCPVMSYDVTCLVPR